MGHRIGVGLLAFLCFSAVTFAQLPDFPSDGAVDNSTFVTPGSPGSYEAIFGVNFTTQLLQAASVPISSDLAGIRVTFNGLPAPVLAAAPLGGFDQLAVQVPFGTLDVAPAVTGGGGTVAQDEGMAQVIVTTPAGSSNPVMVPINRFSPGIWTVTNNGQGQGWVTFANTLTVAAPVGALGRIGFVSRPAKEDDVLTIFSSGLGAVKPPIQDGFASCFAVPEENIPEGQCKPDLSNFQIGDLRFTVDSPEVLIDGVQIPSGNVIFSGLAPQFVALYQVNFIMPAGTATGDAVPIQLSIGGFTSPDSVTITIE